MMNSDDLNKLIRKIDNEKVDKTKQEIADKFKGSQTSKIGEKYNINLTKSMKELEKVTENYDKDTLSRLLSSLGFISGTESFVELGFSIWKLSKISQIYENIEGNPLALRTLLERLPEDSQYIDRRYIYKNNEIDFETVPSLIGSIDLLKTISASEMLSFYHFLSTTPFLGLYHKTGKKIFEYFDKLDKKCIKTKIKEKLYHGRIRETKEKPLIIQDLYKPPYYVATHGRANLQGISALYFSNNPETVVRELGWEKGKNPIDGFEIKLNRNFTMLDMRDDECPLFSYCYFQHNKPNEFNSYIVPNFIADCCRYKKIDGMIYNSVHDKSSNNYVFLNPNESWFKTYKLFSWDGKLNWVNN